MLVHEKRVHREEDTKRLQEMKEHKVVKIPLEQVNQIFCPLRDIGKNKLKLLLLST